MNRRQMLQSTAIVLLLGVMRGPEEVALYVVAQKFGRLLQLASGSAASPRH